MISRPPYFTLFPYTTLFRSILEQILVVRFVLPKERAADLFEVQWGQHVPDSEIIDVDTMARETIVNKCEGKPSWQNLLSASDRKSTRLNSSHEWISYAVFCL